MRACVIEFCSYYNYCIIKLLLFIIITQVVDIFRVIWKFHVDPLQLQLTRFYFRLPRQVIINYNDIIIPSD